MQINPAHFIRIRLLVLVVALLVAGAAHADDGSAYVQLSGGVSLAGGQIHYDALDPAPDTAADLQAAPMVSFCIGVVSPGEAALYGEFEMAYLRVNAAGNAKDQDIGLYMLNFGAQIDLDDACYLRMGVGVGAAYAPGDSHGYYADCGCWEQYTDYTNAFVWQCAMSVGVRVGEDLDVFAGYRAVWINDLAFETGTVSIPRRDIVEVGVRLHF